MYQVSLVVDDEVIDGGHSENCKHAMHDAFAVLAGIPQAEVTVRRDGKLVAWFHTNHRGAITEIETYFKPVIVLSLNPDWRGWPKFINTPHGTVEQALAACK